MSVFAVKIHGK